MDSITRLLNWFAGDGRYMDLAHCMDHDHLWIALTVLLDLAVAGGYVVIAMHWWTNQRLLPDVPAKRALAQMRNIFLFCGVCGYLFIPIKMVWPAWRLYDIFMLVLVYVTWRYAWNARDLRVVYRELGRSSELARDLEQSREEARRKAWFLTAVSHDLRTPLNAVMLSTDAAALRLGCGDAAGAKEIVQAIKSNAAATARLLESLMEYATVEWSMEQPQVAEFDLAAVQRESVDRARSALNGRELAIRSTCPGPTMVRTDRRRLERVLDNLLANAMKYTERGSILVETEVVGNRIEIHVIDTGCGIPAEAHERIFEEFYQIGNSERNPAKGFGLGLPIARRLARQLGGDVTVESAPGQGSRFSILLPNIVAQDGERIVPLASAPANT